MTVDTGDVQGRLNLCRFAKQVGFERQEFKRREVVIGDVWGLLFSH